ncbi:hypothetical protein G6F66_009406 [Rhizopus arrhizus]|nr:hypothetical protein G6F66_009406 [Rhizopus arrhizus]
MSTVIKPSSFNRSSPIIFPSSSPTPKLYATLSKKIPEVEPWQDATLDFCQSPNLFGYEDSILKMREKYHLSSTDSPLSMVSDIQLEESDHLLNEEVPTSSVILSKSPIKSVELHQAASLSSSDEENVYKQASIECPTTIKTTKHFIDFPDAIELKNRRFGSFRKVIVSKMKKATIGI